jgi:hypothetical protein
MRKFTFCCFLLIGIASPLRAEVLIDFDELDVYSGGEAPPAGDGEYFDGYGSSASEGSWTSRGASFNTSRFGPGWSYSYVNDTSTEGFQNQWAAITGTDFSGNGNYALASSFSPNGAIINLPEDYRPGRLQVTNTTYAALSMLNGDDFAKKFGGETGNDPDFFAVTFTGHRGLDATGTITGEQQFLLADYRFDDNALDYIVDEWSELDLSTLGFAKSVSVSFQGSDIGQFGLNTPSYVAIDNFALTAVPEPGTFAMLGLGAIGLAARRRRRLLGRGANRNRFRCRR